MTPHDPADHPMSAPPRPAGRLLWVAAGGLLVVAAAGAVRLYLDRDPGAPTDLAGRPADPAWVKQEQEQAKRAEELRKAAPAPDGESPVPVVDVPEYPKSDPTAFRIAEDHRVYDLRAWKEVKPGDGPHTAAVVLHRRVVATKTAPADRFDIPGRTTGADVVLRCEGPHPERAKVFSAKGPPLDGGKPTVDRLLSVDVSDVPVGAAFEVSAKTTFWNSLQTPEEQWFQTSTTGAAGSQRLSILVLFPDAKPFKGGGLRAGPAAGELDRYDGTQIVFKGAGGSWVFWEVPGPKPDQRYRLDWKW